MFFIIFHSDYTPLRIKYLVSYLIVMYVLYRSNSTERISALEIQIENRLSVHTSKQVILHPI